MDMQPIILYIFIIANIGYNSEAQQIYRNQIQVASKPAQNEFVRLSEIPFQNAVRAVSTPPRDHVPIMESQQDIPPPPRPSAAPQQLPNQPVYNFNTYTPPQPQTYSSVGPLSLGYNTQFPVKQAPNTPMSFQYLMMNDFPKEIYNFLYHTTTGNNGYPQVNNEYSQTTNRYPQASNEYFQGNNGYSHVSNGYSQANNEYPQENNGHLQGNNYYIQQSQVYPNTQSEYQTPVTYVPVANNNNAGEVLSQKFKSIPVYNNYQSPGGYHYFKPSVPLRQNNDNNLNHYQNQINFLSSNRYRNGKSAALALPSNNNVQYTSSTQGTNSFVPSTMFVPLRTPRMTGVDNRRNYLIGSKFVPETITYVNL